MAMFDYYQPSTQLLCPTCGAELKRWQGKDGPSALFVWQQGIASPIDQLVDEDLRCALEVRAEFRLPASFTIYSYSCVKHPNVVARCKCVAGVWTETALAAER